MAAYYLKQLFTILAVMAWALTAPAIPSGVYIDATLRFDTDFATNGAAATHNGRMLLRQGVFEATSDYTNGTNPDGPLGGLLRQPGDGVLIKDAAASSPANSGTQLGIDAELQIINETAYGSLITLMVSVTNQVDAGGSNAWVHSEFTLDDEQAEIAFTDIESDTLYGDSFNGTATGSFGAELVDNLSTSITVTVPPFGTRTLTAEWTLKIETLTASATASNAFGGSILIQSIEPVDTDGDGLNDPEETIAGTDSNDPDDVLEAAINAQGTTLSWPSVVDRTYSIYTTTNLLTGPWIAVEVGITNTPPLNQHPVPVLTNGIPAQFYIIGVELMPK